MIACLEMEKCNFLNQMSENGNRISDLLKEKDMDQFTINESQKEIKRLKNSLEDS